MVFFIVFELDMNIGRVVVFIKYIYCDGSMWKYVWVRVFCFYVNIVVFFVFIVKYDVVDYNVSFMKNIKSVIRIRVWVMFDDIFYIVVGINIIIGSKYL